MINQLPVDKYYTPQQVQHKLGITEPALRNLVRTGQLRRVTPPGKKHGVFDKKEVDAFFSRWLAFLSHEDTSSYIFSRATLEDEQEEYDLASSMFGHAVHDMKTREAWMSKNPEVDFIVRDKGKLVAFFNLLPVTHQTIEDFMTGRVRGWEISAENVLAFEPGKPIELILMAMVTTADAEESKRKEYSAELLRGLVHVFRNWGESGIIITNMYATSSTKTGINILVQAGFKEVMRMGKRIGFQLNVEDSNLPLLHDYKEALNQWKSNQ